MGGRGTSSSGNRAGNRGMVRAFPKVKDLARRLTKAERELVEKEVEDWKSDVGYRFWSESKKEDRQDSVDAVREYAIERYSKKHITNTELAFREEELNKTPEGSAFNAYLKKSGREYVGTLPTKTIVSNINHEAMQGWNDSNLFRASARFVRDLYDTDKSDFRTKF